MVAWGNHVGVSEIARLVGRDKSTVSREIRPNGWYSPVAGRMWCYRASTAHDKSRRRALWCRRQPLLADARRLELVALLIRESAPAPPGADRGPHHDRVPRSGRERHDHPSGRSTAAWGTTLSAGTTRMNARLRHRKGRLDGRAGPVTHELSERPAIADRRERVGEGEGDTVAGRMSGAVGHPGAAGPPGGAWWVARLPPNTRRTSHWSLSGPWPLTSSTPSPWTGATSSPSAPPSKNHWAPPSTSARPAAPGSAAPMKTPTACCASTSPREHHWTTSALRGSNRCTINSTNDHANASAGNP